MTYTLSSFYNTLNQKFQGLDPYVSTWDDITIEQLVSIEDFLNENLNTFQNMVIEDKKDGYATSGLITASAQLKTLDDYAGSLYYYEPLYQLMRQTLWAENVVAHNATERLAADNYLHIHIIPAENDELLLKKYKASGDTMEKSWRNMLIYQSKYIIVDPADFLAPMHPFIQN